MIPKFYTVLVFLFVFLFLQHLDPPYHHLKLSLTVTGPADTYQVFFDRGEGLNIADSIYLRFPGGDSEQTVSVILPAVEILQIRIDPGTKLSKLLIREICLGIRCWRGDTLVTEFRPRRDISDFILKDNSLFISTYGKDPIFETQPFLTDELKRLSSEPKLSHLFFAALAAVLSFFALRLRRPALITNHLTSISLASSLIATLLFFLGTHQIARLVPPFQGADESDHAGKLIALETENICGNAPGKFAELWSTVASLPHHPENKLSHSLVDKLFSEIHPAPPESSLGTGACRYNNSYLLPVGGINALQHNVVNEVPAINYLYNSRRALSLFAAFIWALGFLIIIFGKGNPFISSDSLVSLRLASYLTAFQFMFLPQVMFLSSVLSQDYLLIAMGVIATCSIFFRVKWLSDFLLIGALWVASAKIFYLLPLGFLVVLHYFFFFQRTPLITKHRFKLSLMALSALPLSIAAVRGVVLRYCASNYCYRLERGGVFHSWSRFGVELKEMFLGWGTLTLPYSFYRDSAFGAFGWLDSYLTTATRDLFIMPTMFALVVGVGAVLYHTGRMVVEGNGKAFKAYWPIYWSFCYWLLAVLSLYLVMVLMQGWCGEGSKFGCGYQKRYELPLYSFIPLGCFYLALHFFQRRRLFPLLLVAQIIVGWTSYNAQLKVIEDRYFDSPSVIDYYLRKLES